jgi:uncharacterized Zn finger protein
MCKHVAAALYGIGARLDNQPELLFTLRQVDHTELVAKVGADALLGQVAAPEMDDSGLESLFGIELDGPSAAPVAQAAALVAAAPAPTSEPDLITAQDLLDEGIPRTTFQNWVTAGHLRKTASRGVYEVTQAGWDRIARFAAAAAGE